MSRTRKTRYQQPAATPPPPERPTGPLPLALRIMLGQVTKGAGKTAFRQRIADWDWQPEANWLLDELPRDRLADALVERFFERGLGDAIRYGIDHEWERFRESTVEALNARLDSHRAGIANDSSFYVEYDEEFKLAVSFEVWGEIANRDNPDERANFDYSVDDAIVKLFGRADRIAHTFKEGDWGSLHFVWDCAVNYRFDPVAVIRNSKSGTLGLIRELAKEAAANAES